MSYGQINYPGIPMGIPPTRYTIAQIGCFLAAFCNLAEANGRPISPVDLNSFFRDNRVYVDADDGVRDDLYWGAVSRWWPDLVVADQGYASLPPTTNAIIKLRARNNFGTHFCKVHSIQGSNVQIIDSWDGKIKSSSAYSPIIAWASYRRNTPAPPPTPPQTYTVTSRDYDGLMAAMVRIGRGSQWRKVADINGLQPPFIIRPGQILKLP